ncbi:spore germination protein GerPC [Paenibacillus sp. GCM10023248]|uniref:spore germination protein GerPC n=1 Tax=Bacillales TaxID=1385 RepID=UPI0023799A37|nr:MULTISPECIES: spore germination protein GerPC [Bacillales]MDD9271048.1 spore germination protein GerPC [Paenibacillus sp. MAHUQ-63]MDR6882814.1 spore germination protein PC [Bacillus sp. 3255]
MPNLITWQQWAEQVCSFIETQKRRIDELETTVKKLQSDLDALKDQKRFHIDKIEYNFDQLKVEKLDGTLTIGISPSSLDNVDDFTVNGASVGKDTAGQDQNPFFQGQQAQVQGQELGIGPEQVIAPEIGSKKRHTQGAGQGKGSGQGQESRQGQQEQPRSTTGSGVQRDVWDSIAQYLQYGVQADMLNLEQKYQYHLDEDYKELIIDDIRKQLDNRIQHYVNQYRGVGFKEPMEAVTTSIVEKTKQDIISAIENYISSLPRKEG